MDNKLKPSDFTKLSTMISVLQNCEAEIVASNIMVILKRTGNEWRELTWSEYKNERLNDGHFSDNEQKYYDQVIPYFKSADTAKLFCPSWGIAKPKND